MRRAQAAAAGLAAAGIALVAAGIATGDDDGAKGVRATASPPRPAATVAARPGLDVWIAQGCGSCHTLAAARSTGVIGPDLDEVLPGQSSSDVLASIVAPARRHGGLVAGRDARRLRAPHRRADLRALAGFLLDRRTRATEPPRAAGNRAPMPPRRRAVPE